MKIVLRNSCKLFVIYLLFINNIYAQTPIYLDSTSSIENRVADLLGRMTLEEKVGQMTQADHAAVNNLDDMLSYNIGSILSGGGSDPENNSPEAWANLYDTFQLKSLQSRLKIPIIYGIDAVHGHSNVVGSTIFPHNIGLGATRNPDLIKEASRITAVEIAATGIDWTFAPCIAVARDERWGRTYESFGETAELSEMFAGPAVLGLQNDSLNTPTSIVACAKHFIGDGGTLGGNDQGNTQISEEELRAIHLPGYIEAIKYDVKTIMASYNSWNGQKLHGIKYLLTDLLKDELGFDGFIVSDWAAIDQIPGDYISDIEISINAGIDMVMVPNNYAGFYNGLISLVNQGKVSQERINDAVKRILKVKFELGLFENPYSDRSYLDKIGSAEHRAVAKQCVRESVVLLQKKDDILPLNKSAKKILVAGNHANDIGLQCGGWTIQWGGSPGNITPGTTILDGIKQAAPNSEVIYNAEGNFDAADADYVIVVVGEQPYAEGGGDKNDLSLPKTQVRMVRKMQQLGIPVITILISGRPMIINPVLHNSDVLLSAWLPGTEGDGIAEVLFGDYAPTGKLPHTWPKNMQQIPINYGDNNYDPLFSYGFGIDSFENSLAGSQLVYLSAMLTESSDKIEISFNKAINSGSLNEAKFNIKKNSSDIIEVSEIKVSEINETVLLITLNEKISSSDIIEFSYLQGNIESNDGGVLEAISSEDVINYDGWGSELVFPGLIEAEDYTNMEGVQTENTSDIGGGINVGWIDDNDWLEYEVLIETAGEYQFDFRVASPNSDARIRIIINNEIVETVAVPFTGDWQNWQTTSTLLELGSGNSTIRLYSEKGGFNLNWIESILMFTDVKETEIIPANFRLEQNYPNPFNPTTTINYAIAESGEVSLKVFDVLGNEVSTLVDGYKPKGIYSVSFNAANLSSGVYFYKLSANNNIEIKKLTFIK
ncbi:MAG: glycoside hydrolase family 3 C-terminal domain-containing protein [Melioribacteraceae bacterium]|nr:glycoside hydrolase family 3 C-terminal domain-containing protein [Melioribacteraceae bacterium]